MSTAKKLPQTSFAVVEGGKSTERYVKVFQHIHFPMIFVSETREILEINQSAFNLTGFNGEDLKNRDLFQILKSPKEFKNGFKKFDREILNLEGLIEEVILERKDKETRIVDVSHQKITEGSHPIHVLTLRDVTDKKKIEKELIEKHQELKDAYRDTEKNHAELKAMQQTLVQAGKMAALGELAAGIAHELNQPLQGIRGYAQEIQEKMGEQADAMDVKTDLIEIVSNVDKMAKIIGYLRTFTRRSTENYEMIQVHEAIDEALKMLSRQFSSRGIVVEKNYDKNLPQIYANPLQLEQVFINLATNARDAIDMAGRGAGKITIKTALKDKFIEIEFTDDGVGIDEKNKTKVFNPFFTTKEVGKGMGLGLSLSYGMLNKIHGTMVVESELGKGARFFIRIPVDFRELA